MPARVVSSPADEVASFVGVALTCIKGAADRIGILVLLTHW
jgi:hypothetical protein